LTPSISRQTVSKRKAAQHMRKSPNRQSLKWTKRPHMVAFKSHRLRHHA
jgi:hypothetical protein